MVFVGSWQNATFVVTGLQIARSPIDLLLLINSFLEKTHTFIMSFTSWRKYWCSWGLETEHSTTGTNNWNISLSCFFLQYACYFYLLSIRANFFQKVSHPLYLFKKTHTFAWKKKMTGQKELVSNLYLSTYIWLDKLNNLQTK